MRKMAAVGALCLLLAGCWDRREIEERANVLALGVDACELPCKVRITRQVAIPGRIPLGGIQEGGGAKEDVEPVAIVTSDGADAPTALARAQAKLNHRLTFAHLRVLLMGEAFAQQGLTEYLDVVRRTPEIRRLMWLVVVEGQAEDVVRARPRLEMVPALFLSDMLEDAVKSGRLPFSNFGQFLTQVANKGEQPTAPLLKMAGPDRVSLAGLAVFHEGRMVGRLSPEEAATYMQLRGYRRGGELIRLTLPDGSQADLTVYGRETRYQVATAGRQFQVHITMHLETDLLRSSSDLDIQNPRTLERIETQAARKVKSEAEALVQKLQRQWQADILGVGERVRAYLPRAWAATPNWSVAFAEAQFAVDVQVNVRQTGLSAH
ncbi:MAG TPA: Ger(x)C family spore germination protein [Symbiobacteriaceae bacterium]|jgi:Ger(x)C family germination protein|nr:Ger(x)C family spore germination protein [Symbiobacteriaceae bacterium]